MGGTRDDGPTLGLEEELHVVDAGSGRLVSRAPEVLAGADPDPADGTAVLELTLSQVETVTGVCRDVDEIVAASTGLRAALARGARANGLALIASGTPLLGDALEQRVAGDERYDPLRARAAGLVAQQLIAGMHLHVGLGTDGDADDDARVAVCDALRPWLPVLLAMTANSPYWLGTDTGFASYRQVHWQRWPVVGPPPRARDAAGWRRAVADVVAAGVVDDASFVYWDVRLATRFPTVEVRVADVVPSPFDVETYAAVVRGLAATALAGHRDRAGWAPLEVEPHPLRAAMWRAARYGLDERLVDPTSGDLVAPHEALASLVGYARPGLESTGDLPRVVDGVRRLLRDGNGAQRQRRAFERAGWPGVLDVVRVRSVDEPAAPSTVNDGNGWVDCACGGRHWGRHGAAGLLLLRPAPGGTEALLQLRAGWTHQGGTWGLPGGARDSHESTSQAARREAQEEAGVDPAVVTDHGVHVVDHGPWSYTYVLATTPAGTAARVANRESDAVEWVALDQVSARDLHPALALAWPELRARLPAVPGRPD